MNGNSYNLRRLPYPVKALFSAFLIMIGVAYLIAIFYLFLMDVKPHEKTGLNVLRDTIQKFYGRRGDTRLEAMLKGSMGEYASEAEKRKIFKWINSGATEDGFKDVKPIFEKNCATCHSPGTGMNLVSLTTYDDVKTVTRTDTGESIKRLAEDSHVHTFGISMVFLLTGAIFSLARINPHVKAVIVVIPFVSIGMDIGSWWFTKYDPVFAYTVIAGGTLMGISLAIQILYSLYDMWLGKR